MLNKTSTILNHIGTYALRNGHAPDYLLVEDVILIIFLVGFIGYFKVYHIFPDSITHTIQILQNCNLEVIFTISHWSL